MNEWRKKQIRFRCHKLYLGWLFYLHTVSRGWSIYAHSKLPGSGEEGREMVSAFAASSKAIPSSEAEKKRHDSAPKISTVCPE